MKKIFVIIFCILAFNVKAMEKKTTFNKELFDKITEKGVIADWREPDVIRVAPVPLYNSFSDVFNFYNILKTVL